MILDVQEPAGGWDAWTPEPGYLYVGVPDEVYHESPGISKHKLDDLAAAATPAHYRHKADQEDEPSEAKIVGAALDCAIFEPENFDHRFLVDRTGLRRNHNDWKAWKAEFQQGRHILREHQKAYVDRMRDAIFANESVRILLSDGYPQVSMYWEDRGERVTERRPTGRLCRSRIDFLGHGHAMALDLKKIQSADDQTVQRQVETYRYNVQEEFYRYGLVQCGHRVEDFVFLFVEEEPPHGVRLLSLHPRYRRLGRLQWERDIERMDALLEAGEWPGYRATPETLPFSGRAAHMLEKEERHGR